ncbi:Peptidase subtilisin-related [Cordyceps militaris]|uniref:Peptidase subtilisin-related n=1 Tax=Cordyceps militaris TaxID=73501 RepID=A0A2H4SBR9_CORMI|nr:Peptidase subtilisin-related [Cordyceps militaris]
MYKTTTMIQNPLFLFLPETFVASSYSIHLYRCHIVLAASCFLRASDNTRPIMVAWSARPLLAGLSIVATFLAPCKASRRRIPGAYIVEYQDGHNSASVVAAMGTHLDHVRAHFNFAHFKGVSIQVNDSVEARSAAYGMSSTASEASAAKNIWPVYAYDRPVLNATLAAPFARRARDDTYTPHVMMQVDQLRALGFDGKGVKVAAIDSGVDYKHPALGGCFGTGCKVSFGYDFVGDAYGNDSNEPKPDDDPMDCGTHGTHVSGILVADANDQGFTGVAPGVTFGMYKVFGCSGGTRTDILMAAAARAAEDGVQVLSCSVGGTYGWSDDGFAYLLSKLARDKGIVVAVAASNEGSKGAFYPSASSNGDSVNSIGSVDLAGKDGTGGTPSAFSSWGPTMDMEFKPQFAGPGLDILSTLPGGKYGKSSGTSMAAPMVAGVMALLIQALGPIKPERMQQLLAASAKPLNFSDGSQSRPVLAPAAQQGAGLVQAMNAFRSTTRIAPSSLSFNDTDHMRPMYNVTVTNAGNATVGYRIFVRPAVSLYVLARNSSYPSAFPNDQTNATGVLSATVIQFTLAAGQNHTFRVAAAPPPTAIDTRRLLLWSGFLSVRGNDSSTVSIPYQGLAGSLRNATTLPAGGTAVARSTDPDRKPVAANTQFVFPKDGAAASNDDLARIVVLLALGTKRMTAEIVADPSGDVVGTLAGGEYSMVTRGDGFGFDWDGQLANGSYAGAGTYKVRVKALRIFGDEANAHDWDSSTTVPIQISYKQ